MNGAVNPSAYSSTFSATTLAASVPPNPWHENGWYGHNQRNLSLVLTDEQSGEIRYRLLETIRQYGAAKLRKEFAEEEPLLRERQLVSPIEANERHFAAASEFHQHRVLIAARKAPAAPDVHYVGLAGEFVAGNLLRRILDARQLELRRRFADQRRRQRLLVAAEPDEEEHSERHEQADRNDEAQHV